MKISYHEDTDSLYIYLSSTPTTESEEVAESTVLHFDEDGDVTGLEVYSEASEKVDLSSIETLGIDNYQSMKAWQLLPFRKLVRQHHIGRSGRVSVEKPGKHSVMTGRYRSAGTGRRITHELARQAVEYSKTVDKQKVS